MYKEERTVNPRLNIDLSKFAHNAAALCKHCHAVGISVAAVTKVYCADRRMLDVLVASPVDYLADSRIENIESYPKCDKPTMLLRLPTPSEALRTVRACDISLNSELATIQKLAEAAASIGKTHGIVMMVDVGDLREGIYFDNEELIVRTIEYILSHKSLRMEGMGLNLTCYGSVIPTKENLSRLCDMAKRVEARFGIELPIISGGNSSTLYLLEGSDMPWDINNLRIGEAMIRGIETAYTQPLPMLRQDVVTLEAEIIELQSKPSMPDGLIGVNAFGESETYVDRGRRLRAIVAVGRQDTDHEGLNCLEPGVEVVGASSDHLIVDVTDARETLVVGDTLHFSMSYGAILRGFTSPYVERDYHTEEGEEAALDFLAMDDDTLLRQLAANG